jgi:hypothetical protein
MTIKTAEEFKESKEFAEYFTNANPVTKQVYVASHSNITDGHSPRDILPQSEMEARSEQVLKSSNLHSAVKSEPTFASTSSFTLFNHPKPLPEHKVEEAQKDDEHKDHDIKP